MLTVALIIANMSLSVLSLWMTLGTQKVLSDVIRRLGDGAQTGVRNSEEQTGQANTATQVAIRYVYPHSVRDRHE